MVASVLCLELLPNHYFYRLLQLVKMLIEIPSTHLVSTNALMLIFITIYIKASVISFL